jgi:hypothetical protein
LPKNPIKPPDPMAIDYDGYVIDATLDMTIRYPEGKIRVDFPFDPRA